MFKELKLALVGTGAFGTRYLNALQTFPGVDLSWVCDLDEERCRKAKEKYRVANATDDFHKACADPGVDAVIVVTPENAHREIVVDALKSGKHVIVEKPLATNEEDGQAMLQAAKLTGKLLMTGFLLRFDWRYAQLHEMLGQIGQVRNIYAYRNFDRSLFELYSRTHSFVENAIHDIDIILWYVQSRVKSVHAYCRNTLGLTNPDINWGILEFESGAIAALQTCWLYPAQKHEHLQWNVGIQVMGDRGVLELAQDQGGFRANIEDEGILLLDQTSWAEIHQEPRGAFAAMLRHFLACLRGDTSYRGTTPEEAIESMRVACQLMQDSQRHDTVH